MGTIGTLEFIGNVDTIEARDHSSLRSIGTIDTIKTTGPIEAIGTRDTIKAIGTTEAINTTGVKKNYRAQCYKTF